MILASERFCIEVPALRLPSSCLLLLGAPLLNASTAPGLKITIRHGMNGQFSESTTYLQSDRRRSEYRNMAGYQASLGRPVVQVYGPRLAMIWRCDLGQIFELNLDEREYHSSPLPKWPTRQELEARAAEPPQPAGPRKPTVFVETNTVDTGERKEFFGYTARHVMTTGKQSPLEGSHSEPSQSVSDGWYIDLDLGLSCEPRLSGHGFLTTSTNGSIREIPTFKTIGKPEKGFPVELKSTSRDALAQPDGTKKEITSTFETRVTELSSAPLDPALFDIPAGFRRVDHLRREPTLPLSVRLEQSWQRLKSVLSRLFH